MGVKRKTGGKSGCQSANVVSVFLILRFSIRRQFQCDWSEQTQNLMKTTFKLFLILACTGLTAAAQSLTTLHSFDFTDGESPYGGVTLSGGVLFGSVEGGVSPGNGGGVFRCNMDGSGFTNVCGFGGSAHPIGGVVVSGSTVYGVTENPGVVFSVGTNGTGLFTVYNFGNGGGQNPKATLTLVGSTLFGTTANGDNLFRVNTGGSAFTNLYDFTSANNDPSTGADTNSDGDELDSTGTHPTYGSLISSGTLLYGVAIAGGSGGNGTVFKFDTFSGNFTTLYSFSNTTFNSTLQVNTNTTGGNPVGTMVLSGNTLYGTTSSGGTAGSGTVFKVDTDGGNFKTLYSFSQTVNLTNADGANPSGGLALSGGTLYGTALNGGSGGEGTVFDITTNGTGFATLYSFSASTGENPIGAVVLAGNSLYGATLNGGTHGDGTVYALTLPPVALDIASSGGQLTLSWPSSATGFVLQSNATLNALTWSNFTGGYNDNGTNESVIILPTGGNAFFRLLNTNGP